MLARRFLVAALAFAVVAPPAVLAIRPIWMGRYDRPSRFPEAVLFTDAVTDKTTGLVWHRTHVGTGDWVSAVHGCYGTEIGGIKGWRLPTMEELMAVFPLYAGAAISVAEGQVLWSATSSAASASDGLAATVTANEYGLDGALTIAPKTEVHEYVCIRGGSGQE